MPLFRVIAGEHCENNQLFCAHKEGNTSRNDLVESDRPLDKVFPNKFRRYAPAPHDVLPVVAKKLPQPVRR
jgi:hypothetical protein